MRAVANVAPFGDFDHFQLVLVVGVGGAGP